MRLLLLALLLLSGCGPDSGRCERECACRTTAAAQHRCLVHCGIHGHGDCACRTEE